MNRNALDNASRLDTDAPEIRALSQLGALLSGPFEGEDGRRLFPKINRDGSFDYHVEKSDTPTQIAEAPRFEAADSFCEYVKDFKDKAGQTIIFASPETREFVACLDWHGSDGAPRKRSHNAHYKPALDPFWEAWAAVNGEWMGQVDCAHFIEEHAPEFVTPDAATMLEIATDFNIQVKTSFKSRKNLSNGMVQLEVKEESEGGGTSKNVSVPKELIIRIPVFFGEEPREFKVFFRHNARVGEPLSFKFDIHRMETIFSEAFLLAATRIGQACGLVVKLGKPR